MRRLAFALVLLAACSPAPPASQPAAEPSAPSAPPRAANADALTLQRAPVAGAWTVQAGARVFAARFNAASASELFAIVCNAGNGALTLTLHQANPSATTLRLITATRTLELPARGAATLTARIARSAPEHGALITTLGTPGDRFAIEAGGAITLLPWTDAIGTTLTACQ